MPKPPSEMPSPSPAPLLKEELNANKDQLDALETHSQERAPGVEDSPTLTTTSAQCKPRHIKLNKTQVVKQKKKNNHAPANPGSQTSVFHETMTNKTMPAGLSQGRKNHQCPGKAPDKKSQSGGRKNDESTTPQEINKKKNETPTAQFPLTRHTPMIRKKKKRLLHYSECSNKSSLSNARKLKKKMKTMSNSTSASTAKEVRVYAAGQSFNIQLCI